MRLLCGEPESQETHVESLQYIHNKAMMGAWNGNVWGQHWGDILNNCAFIYRTMKRSTTAAATTEYQSSVDTSFLLTIQNQQVSNKTTQRRNIRLEVYSVPKNSR